MICQVQVESCVRACDRHRRPRRPAWPRHRHCPQRRSPNESCCTVLEYGADGFAFQFLYLCAYSLILFSSVVSINQPGNCSPPPGTYRSGAIEHCPFSLGSKYVCGYSWTSTLLAVGITPTTTAGFFKRSPRFTNGFTGRSVISADREGRDGVNDQTLPPGRSKYAVLLDSLIKPCPLAAQISCTFRPTYQTLPPGRSNKLYF